MTYPPHPSAPLRRHSTPVPPLPDYGRIRRPARAEEHLPAAADYGYDDHPEPAYAPDDRFYEAPPAYRDDDSAGYGGYDHNTYDHDDRYDQHGYDSHQNDGWDDDYYPDEAGWDDDGAWGPQRTNRMAIWGLVLAFLFSPLGLVFSAIGLVQAPRRGERGRGLAVTGLIVSLIVLAAGLLFGAAVAREVVHRLTTEVTSSTAPVTQAAGGSSAPAPAAGPAPATVLDACNALMPALISAEQQVGAATTQEQGVQVITNMRNAVQQAAGAPDPGFQQDLQKLAADLQQTIDAASTGNVPANLNQTLLDDSFAVGTDCGLAGWTQ
jgi:hypothetical protein